MEEHYEIRCKKYRCETKEIVDRIEGSVKLSHIEATRTNQFLKETVRDVYVKNGKIYGIYDVRGFTTEEIFHFVLEHDICNFSSNYFSCEKNEPCYEVPQEMVHKETRKSYFLSAAKQYSGSTANMQIFSDEYLNLTYLNSVWVQYAIQNQKIGGWKRGQMTIDYANSIAYLNAALSYLREREREESALLAPYMEFYPDWQVIYLNGRWKNSITGLPTGGQNHLRKK